jgi:hypothetical protein
METKALVAAKIEAAQNTKFQTVLKINRILEAQLQDMSIQLEVKDEEQSRDLTQEELLNMLP